MRYGIAVDPAHRSDLFGPREDVPPISVQCGLPGPPRNSPAKDRALEALARSSVVGIWDSTILNLR